MSPTVTTDIRGLPRPEGSDYDVGAYEGPGGPTTGDPTLPPPPTPTGDVVPNFIPKGSLAFTGFGDAPIKFLSFLGADLGQPSSAPINPGVGCDSIIVLKGSGRIVTIGGGAPNFPTTGIGIWNADFTVHAEGATGAHHFAGVGVGRDDIGRFYGSGISGSQSYIYRYDDSGAILADWAPLPSSPIWVIYSISVSVDGSIAYFGAFNSAAVGFPPATTVYAHNLTSDTSLGIFKAESGYHLQNIMPILGIRGGDVLICWCKNGGGIGFINRYDSAGTFLKRYTLPGTNSTPIGVTPGFDDTYSFWVGYYNDAVTTASGVTIAEIRLLDGAILHSFNPESGSFEFDGPFCVLSTIDIGAPITSPPPGAGTPNSAPSSSIPLVTCTPTTIVSSPARNSGCNEGGEGWTPSYLGASGFVPIGANPIDGELLTGKDNICIWAEMQHDSF